MKKIFLATLLFLGTYIAVQAQTKEETINFLQEKLQKYIFLKYGEFSAEDIKVKVSECSIFVGFTFVVTENGQKSKYPGQYYNIPTQGVVLDSFIFMKEETESITEKMIDKKDISLTNVTMLNITKGEHDLYGRLQQAVDHLATFCSKK